MNKINQDSQSIKLQQDSTNGLPSGQLTVRKVDKGKEEATVSRVHTVIQNLPDEVINYMMRNHSNTSTFNALRKTCHHCYLALSDKSLKEIINFRKNHQLNIGSQIALKFLHFLAHKDEHTPTTDELTKAINPLPLSLKDASEQLPILKKRYKKLQTIFDDLRQGLTVFRPSLLAYAYVVINVLLKSFVDNVLNKAFLKIFSPFDKTDIFKLKLQPCTYWQATEKFLHLISNICGKMLTDVLICSFIFPVPIIGYFMLPRQVAQFRTAATSILHSVAKDLGY